MTKHAHPTDVRKVYTIAALMGRPMYSFNEHRKACAIAARFTPAQLDRMLNFVSRRRQTRGRLTLVS